MLRDASTRPVRLVGWAAAVGLLAASLGNPAHAVVLWYDGFDTTLNYTAGATIAGQSGGLGTFFNNPWIQPGGDDQLVLTTSLSKPGQLLPSIGGSLGDTDATGCCITGRVGRTLTQPWSGRSAPEGTFYMGFLANYGSTEAADDDPHHRAFEMWEGTFDDANRNLMLGYSTFAGLGTQLSLMVKDSTSGVQLVKPLSENLEFANDGMTHCVVMKFELSNAAGADRVSVFLDPMGPLEPATASAVISAADFGAGGGLDLQIDRMGGITQFSFTGVEVAAKMDELRVGTEFADVALCGIIPEPATFALLGAGAVGSLLIARRKRG
jgi:hypothetical protein